METIAFIANPTTKYINYFSESIARKILPQNNLLFFTSEKKGHETELTKQAINAGATKIIAVGGDGTIHHIIQQLVDTKIPLGIIPTTLGGSLANYLDIPKDTIKALEIIKSNNIQTKNTICISNNNDKIYAATSLGIGFSAFIANHFNRESLEYYSRFWLSVFNHYEDFKPNNIFSKFNFQQLEFAPFELLISTIDQYGGNLKVFQQRPPSDSEFLDVMIIKSMSIFRMMIYSLSNVFGANDQALDIADYHKIGEMNIKLPKETDFQIDMESYILKNNVDIKLKRNSLKILTP